MKSRKFRCHKLQLGFEVLNNPIAKELCYNLVKQIYWACTKRWGRSLNGDKVSLFMIGVPFSSKCISISVTWLSNFSLKHNR